MTNELDLGLLTECGAIHNLAGKPRGVNARQEFHLDSLDHADGPVNVSVPSDIYAISASFFLGMFSQSVEALGGKERFLDHYRFDANDVVMEDIARGIERSLMGRVSAA